MALSFAAMVHVRRAMQANGEIGPPKNGKARTVPIEPTLLPLLEAMHVEAVKRVGVDKGFA